MERMKGKKRFLIFLSRFPLRLFPQKQEVSLKATWYQGIVCA